MVPFKYLSDQGCLELTLFFYLKIERSCQKSIFHCFSDKGLKVSVVNQTWNSINGESLKISLTISLNASYYVQMIFNLLNNW